MQDRGLARATDAFKAAGHPARLRILAMLRGGGLCVCQITAVLELAASTVSAHLAELKRAGLVVERKTGRWVRYALAGDAAVAGMLRQIRRRLAGDARVDADTRLLRRLRRIPVEMLCRAQLDLVRLGVKRPRARSKERV